MLKPHIHRITAGLAGIFLAFFSAAILFNAQAAKAATPPLSTECAFLATTGSTGTSNNLTRANRTLNAGEVIVLQLSNPVNNPTMNVHIGPNLALDANPIVGTFTTANFPVTVNMPITVSGVYTYGYRHAGGPGAPAADYSFSCHYDASILAAPADTSSPEDKEPWFYSPLPSTPDFTAAHQQVLYNDVQACGVFEVRWWGVKFILPGNFPGCADSLSDVQIACMNSSGEWVATEVKDQKVTEGTFHATIYQHGACGIFPK